MSLHVVGLYGTPKSPVIRRIPGPILKKNPSTPWQTGTTSDLSFNFWAPYKPSLIIWFHLALHVPLPPCPGHMPKSKHKPKAKIKPWAPLNPNFNYKRPKGQETMASRSDPHLASLPLPASPSPSPAPPPTEIEKPEQRPSSKQDANKPSSRLTAKLRRGLSAVARTRLPRVKSPMSQTRLSQAWAT